MSKSNGRQSGDNAEDGWNDSISFEGLDPEDVLRALLKVDPEAEPTDEDATRPKKRPKAA